MTPIRILLVDDHAVVRAGLRNALEHLPDVDVVGELVDGAQVMAEIERLSPNCLLIDVTMPHFEPITAIEKIREAYSELKILVVSAYDDDVYVQGLLRAGVNGYHLKDQPLGDLRLAVERVMAGERWVTGRLLDKLLNPVQARPLPSLTPRQRDILLLLQQGYDNQSIALEIGISVRTVENHLTRLYRQLNVQSRLEAVHFMQENPAIVNQANAPVRPKSIVAVSAESPHILVVDDNGRYRHQIQRMIARLQPNATIHEAENTLKAVALAKAHRHHLIFVDVVLGNEDGINCVQQIKRYAADARVILMSAYPDREFHRRGLKAGASALLDKKDLDTAALQQIIEDMPTKIGQKR